ncbi:MAG: hypothetical protein KDD83_11780, partial [Caldilineaceae bacterium]|nr:hypothetical protein [Caldilineaceae bacterium]
MDPTVPASSEPQAFEFTTGDGLTVTGALRLNPVHTCLVHLLPEMKQPLVTVTVANAGAQTRRLQVDLDVKRFGDAETHVVTVQPGTSEQQHFAPTFDHKLLAALAEVTPATIHVAVRDLDADRPLGQDTLHVQLLPVHSAPLSSLDPQTGQRIDQTRFLGVFITEGDAALNRIVATATDLLPPGRQMIGNRGGDPDVLVEAIYNALAARNIGYAHLAIDINPAAATQASQRIQLPNEVLQAEKPVANCLDGALLFASLLRRIGLETAIVLVPGHALVGWRPIGKDDDWRYLDTTKLGEATFAQAQQSISPARFLPHDEQADAPLTSPRRWEVAKLRAAGIRPLPETPLGAALRRGAGTNVAAQEPGMSPSLKDYLWHWFDRQNWTDIPLALFGLPDEHISLLDVYVPLPVDARLVWREDRRGQTTWAVESGDRSGREAEAADAAAAAMADGPELARHARSWSTLGADADALAPLAARLQPESGRRKREDTVRQLVAEHAASVRDCFVLVGDPGSGKSSFLRHLTLCMAGELLHQAGDGNVPPGARLARLPAWLPAARTPLYIELHEYFARPELGDLDSPRPKVQTITLEDFWQFVTQRLHKTGVDDTARELRELYRDGRLLILLDGLDEVPHAADPKRRQQIKDLVALLAQRDNRIIVTSRPYAYRSGDWTLDGFGRTDLIDLQDEQLAALTANLFAKVLPAAAEHERATFLEEIRGVRADLRANPLFFTLLAAIWLRPPGARHLPATRGELYHRAVDLLLEDWIEHKTGRSSWAAQLDLNRDELRTVLQVLALRVHQRSEPVDDTTIFSAEELHSAISYVKRNAAHEAAIEHVGEIAGLFRAATDQLERSPGLLIASFTRQYRFLHRSFQEHLAACELLYRPEMQRTPPPLPREFFPLNAKDFPGCLTTAVLNLPQLWQPVAQLAADELQYTGR